jgi:hypothetical protein
LAADSMPNSMSPIDAAWDTRFAPGEDVGIDGDAFGDGDFRFLD